MAVDRLALVSELQRVTRRLEDDVRSRAEGPDGSLEALQAEHAAAVSAGRTAMSYVDWLDGEVAQSAASWALATAFVRFCEDNGLVDEPWITGPGDRGRIATERQTAHFLASPLENDRDWLLAAFDHLGSHPALAALFDARNPLRRLPISADGAEDLIAFWRRTDDEGDLVFDFTDPDLSTRFLGDLYQDLSEYAKKRYALLQTPEFVEEFILDRTLTPALAEFGLDGLRLIDPTCGSGHFLLGAFHRLLDSWNRGAPALDRRERVQRALDSVHGVDLNPFAVAIARFRLTVAAMKVSGITRLSEAPGFRYHLAVGDSLLAGYAGRQTDLLAQDDGAAGFAYAAEDVTEHPGILERGRYHVVVGNPPYITVKDKALNEAYRASYSTCHRQYALSVPFLELFFALAQRGNGDQPAGYVGQITANSFMKREFGTKVIEQLLSGRDADIPVDLTEVIDTSGAYIPGHGTPTVILVGRKRFPRGDTVRAVLGVRGEPGQPEDPARGLVWTQIADHVDNPGFDGTYVTVTDVPRTTLSTHPWSLGGGSAGDVRSAIEGVAAKRLADAVDVIGYTGQTNADEVFLAPAAALTRRRVEPDAHRQVVVGDVVRDFVIGDSDHSLFLYDADRLLDIDAFPGSYRWMWPTRTVTWSRATFAKVTYRVEGRSWWEWHQVALQRLQTPLSLAFAFVATHNHVVLDRGGKVFKQSAPVIKLPAGASVEEHLDLLGVLNSSTACFWMKQVSHSSAGSPMGDAGARVSAEGWDRVYQFNGTPLRDFPLPSVCPREIAATLDALAQRAQDLVPAAVVARGGSLAEAEVEWAALRAEMVFRQEELDWWVYSAFGLLGDEDLTWSGDPLGLALGERAFEIALARRLAAGDEESAWFDRHGSTPITDIPSDWPEGYRDLVQRRLDLIASDPRIGLLERPEYKRRWAVEPWEKQAERALRSWLLDRLEDPALWRDGSGRPTPQSLAQLAGRLAGDQQFLAGLAQWTGRPDADVGRELARLVADEHVPFLAALRYKPTGLRKRAAWEEVWEVQRAEDRGEAVGDIPVPPKYTSADFLKASYWHQRGKLDVPKERFVSYPGAERSADPTLVLGWAGWDHAEQGQALASLALQRAQRDAWDADRLVPLLAGLAELEPWVRQWHDEVDPALGMSPAAALTATLERELARLGLTCTDLAEWRPPAAARGRRAR